MAGRSDTDWPATAITQAATEAAINKPARTDGRILRVAPRAETTARSEASDP